VSADKKDPRAEVGEEVRVGVGPVEFRLKLEFHRTSFLCSILVSSSRGGHCDVARENGPEKDKLKGGNVNSGSLHCVITAIWHVYVSLAVRLVSSAFT